MSRATSAEDSGHGEAVELLLSKEHVEVAGHADADGVSAAALLCMALEANDVGFTFTPVEKPPDAVELEADVYCDLGASYAEHLDDCVVVDHHEGEVESPSVVSVVDSSTGSASEIAYEVALAMGFDRPDVALVGAAGDGDLPEELVSHAVDLGLATETGSLWLDLSQPAEVLAHYVDPYTRLTGDYAAARDFVDRLALSPDSQGGDGEVDGRLETAVTLLAAEDGDPDAVEELTGAVVLDGFDRRSARDVAATVEACGRTGRGGLAFSVVYAGAFDEPLRVRRAFESRVASAVEDSEEVAMDGFTLVRTTCEHTSEVADVYSRWIDGGVEDVVVVDVDRGRASLRSGSVDCASAAEEAAAAVGGDGGGHRTQAGAEFDADDVDAFVDHLEEGWR